MNRIWACFGGRRKGLLLVFGVPCTAVAMPCCIALAAFVRGTWADSVPLMPASVEAGSVCHVYDMPGEGKQVRCAMLMPYSLDRIWEAVTDYDNFGDICECLRADEIVHDPNGTCYLEARVKSGLSGEVPCTMELHHEQLLDQYRTTWDQPSGDVLVDRGHWVLTPKGPSETLVELSVEVEVRGVPTFILRNLNLRRLPEVVHGLERHVRTNSKGKKW